MQGFIAPFKKFATFITYYTFMMNFSKYLNEKGLFIINFYDIITYIASMLNAAMK